MGLNTLLTPHLRPITVSATAALRTKTVFWGDGNTPDTLFGERVMKTRIAAVAAALLVASLVATADAGYVIDVSQLGANVVATGSGSLDLTDLSSTIFTDVSSGETGVYPSIAGILTGPPAAAGEMNTLA